jgi:hypothetical protein
MTFLEYCERSLGPVVRNSPRPPLGGRLDSGARRERLNSFHTTNGPNGPFGITYVNPEDDPSKGMASK